ncbi:hypothetical protein ACJJIK_21525 [Microbulbifer sp. ZKSA006]|uniref:hypothetical protein n=1 Tax=Microbulbifer sp. ZKSA006 TaxID=3243390 RepID=UPI00403A23DD
MMLVIYTHTFAVKFGNEQLLGNMQNHSKTALPPTTQNLTIWGNGSHLLQTYSSLKMPASKTKALT